MDSGGNYWRDRGYDGTGIKVAVLDGGLNSSSAFNNVMLVTNQMYGYNSNTDSFEKNAQTAIYSNIHGQQIAEAIAGNQNGYAPNVNLITGNVSDNNGYTDAISLVMGGIWATNENARIINASFAYGGFDAPDISTYVTRPLEIQAQSFFTNVIGNNVLVVNAAGNNGESVSNIANSPTALPSFVDMTKSQAKDQLLIVGATEENGEIASYSNYAGYDADVQNRFILAPGYATTHDGSNIYGTSPAAANVSGAAAVMMQRWQNLGGKEVSAIMLSTANKTFSNYDPSVHGAGILDLVAAFNPIGQTSLTKTNLENKAPLSQATISVPSGFSVTKSATVNVLDSYNRTFGVDAKAFVQQEKQQTFTNLVDALNGREFEYSQHGLEVKSVNGEVTSVKKLKSFNLMTASGNKYTARSNGLSYLSDKSNFDQVASISRNYIGFEHESGVFAKTMFSGNDLTGYSTGAQIGWMSNGLFASSYTAYGKMSNTLNGQNIGFDLGYKSNGLLIKGYAEQTNFLESTLFNDLRIQKTGLLLSGETEIGSTGKAGIMLKMEQGNGASSITVVDSVNSDNTLNLSKQSVAFEQLRQEIGLSYQNSNFLVMGLLGNIDNGLILGYKNNF